MLRNYSQSQWRMRSDLIKVFKIYKGIDNVIAENDFTIDQSTITKRS